MIWLNTEDFIDFYIISIVRLSTLQPFSTPTIPGNMAGWNTKATVYCEWYLPQKRQKALNIKAQGIGVSQLDCTMAVSRNIIVNNIKYTITLNKT